MFIGRKSEIENLDNLFKSDSPEFFILYGRRRVGKTELLQQFCKGKRAVYFLASQVKETDNLRQMKEAVSYVISDPLLETMEFNEWATALNYLAIQAEKEKLIVILDEFQYLCEENKALPSIIQKFWDMRGKNTRLLFVICGSQISFMEREVLSEKSPLFGRRTSQQKLLPFSFLEASLFLPEYSSREKLICYGILGGIPAYLSRFSSMKSIKQNVLKEFLQVQGYLFDEVNLLLRMELTNTAVYASILKAIASGCTRLNEIAGRIGMESTTVNKYLHVLRELYLVRREVSITERTPEKSKKGLYFIDDNYVNFWFRFILPHLSLIQAGDGEIVWDRLILPQLPGYMGYIFERICQEYVRLFWGKTYGRYVKQIGKCWHRDYDIDLIAEFVDGRYLIAECKWWQSLVGRNVLEALKEKAACLSEKLQKDTTFALFSLSGFTQELITQAEKEGVPLVSAEELFGLQVSEAGERRQSG